MYESVVNLNLNGKLFDLIFSELLFFSEFFSSAVISNSLLS